jgi:tRNA(Ile)-lysidine synthase
MENLLIEFQASLKRLGVAKKDRLLLAVSGGLDSVVLAACCAMSGLDFGIAHVNFQLREAESDRDEQFVRQLAKKYERPFYIKKFNTREQAALEKCSIQVVARKMRYDWFNTLLNDEAVPFQFLATAHHLDDNIETMLMHFFRGTGIAGLSGMPEKKGKLIRPMLTFSKSNLKEFAESKDISWMEDSSNALNDYTRNYFRNDLIPSAESIFPELLQNLKKNLHRFSETNQLFQQTIAAYKKRLLVHAGQETHIPILLLKKSNPIRTILYEILKEFDFMPAQTDEVIRLMESKNGKYISGSSHRIIKNRRWLIVAPLEISDQSHLIIEQTDRELIYTEGKLRLKTILVKDTEPISKEPGIAQLDAEKIQFPLILRKWKTGDYFYPLGMNKKKKLARFFIDQKLSKTAKEKVGVLVMDSRIIWVVGHRIDNRFRIGPSTLKILQIQTDLKSQG